MSDGEEFHEPKKQAVYGYDLRQENPGGRQWVALDKTTAMILSAIGSAAIAVAIAAGSALVGKIDETAQAVERTRAERLVSYGEISRTISVVETKLDQMLTQISTVESRIEKGVDHELKIRDKQIEDIDKQIDVTRRQTDTIKDESSYRNREDKRLQQQH